MPNCWIIAGPNGAGKTTFALEFLPSVAGCDHFINADLIAAGLQPLNPEAGLVTASRLFLTEIRMAIQRGIDFGFETTLSGLSHLRRIRSLRESGWEVELIYLALGSAELSRLRVTERVAHGGHNVSDDDLVRRFPRSLRNLLTNYGSGASRTLCFMNEGESPELVFTQTGDDLTIHDQENYILLRTLSHEPT